MTNFRKTLHILDVWQGSKYTNAWLKSRQKKNYKRHITSQLIYKWNVRFLCIFLKSKVHPLHNVKIQVLLWPVFSPIRIVYVSVKTCIVAYSVQWSGSEINTESFQWKFKKPYNGNKTDRFLILSLNLFFQCFLKNNDVNYYFLTQSAFTDLETLEQGVKYVQS